ncbi:MAG: HNH endonuclease family protein [Pauljensenia sp.]
MRWGSSVRGPRRGGAAGGGRSITDVALVLFALVALVWAFFPGLGPDLLGLQQRLGWPTASSGEDLTDLPATEVVTVLRSLPARSDDDVPDYRREAFGTRWADTDHNGCDTRNDILARDLARPVFKPGTHDCVVASGTLAEPYTGHTIEFVRGEGTSELVQIDHVVALADAWRSGAWQWQLGARQEFANDPLNLLAVDGAANQEKEAGRADQWLPPDADFRCPYVARQIAVKAAWGLSVTDSERDAMADVLRDCPDQVLPTR